MDNLLIEEEEELRKIKHSSKKRTLADLNKKNLSSNDLEEIFCEI
jgi:hypothetical protein|tara:strand:+ start:2707 stop:2841 length:135 start_codon:yes stop_codon:yes gene_type:complete